MSSSYKCWFAKIVNGFKIQFSNHLYHPSQTSGHVDNSVVYNERIVCDSSKQQKRSILHTTSSHHYAHTYQLCTYIMLVNHLKNHSATIIQIMIMEIQERQSFYFCCIMNDMNLTIFVLIFCCIGKCWPIIWPFILLSFFLSLYPFCGGDFH